MDHILFIKEISDHLKKEGKKRVPDSRFRSFDDEQKNPFFTISDQPPHSEAPQAIMTCVLSLHYKLCGVIALRDDGERCTDQSTRRAPGGVSFGSLKFIKFI